MVIQSVHPTTISSITTTKLLLSHRRCRNLLNNIGTSRENEFIWVQIGASRPWPYMVIAYELPSSYRAVCEQFASSYGTVTEQLQSSYRAVTEQLQSRGLGQKQKTITFLTNEAHSNQILL